MTFTDDQVPVKRHRISRFATYEIQVSDFDRIESVAGSVGPDLTFATVGLSAFLTLAITLLTVPITNERLHNEFFIVACISLGVTLICGARWWRQRGELSKLMGRIRQDLGVGPLGDSDNPIGQAALDTLPLVSAPHLPVEIKRNEQTGAIEMNVRESLVQIDEASPAAAETSKTEPSAKP
jgi:hypothetical protein